MFFDEFYQKGLAWYTAYFAHRREEQLNGEICPSYFDVKAVPDRIRKINPECKIIINLRDPIARAASLYRHHFAMGRVAGSFAEAISRMPRIVDSGRYARYIPMWLDTFGADRVTFVLLEDIRTDPETVLDQVYNFLRVERIATPDVAHEKIYAFMTMPRSRWLAQNAARLATTLRANRLHKVIEVGKRLGFNIVYRVYSGSKESALELTASDHRRLLEEYEADITFLEALLGQELSHWRRIA